MDPTQIINLIIALTPLIEALITWIETIVIQPKSGAEKKAAIMALMGAARLPQPAQDALSIQVDVLVARKNSEGSFKHATA